jgi:hypothetical protein
MAHFGIVKRLLAGAAIAWPGVAAAACDPAILAAAEGPVPYASRAQGRYCEGSYARPVRASFEILSVTAGPISFASTDTQITVSAPLSPAGAELSVRARGRAISYGFQMDTILAPPGTFEWPTATLRTLGLTRNDIGVFGFRASGTSITYVPVAVKRTSAAASGESILVLLIAPEHLAGPIEYRIAPRGRVPPDTWQTASETGLNKGEVVTVRLAANALAAPVTLSVRARPRADPSRWVRLPPTDLSR